MGKKERLGANARLCASARNRHKARASSHLVQRTSREEQQDMAVVSPVPLGHACTQMKLSQAKAAAEKQSMQEVAAQCHVA